MRRSLESPSLLRAVIHPLKRRPASTLDIVAQWRNLPAHLSSERRREILRHYLKARMAGQSVGQVMEWLAGDRVQCEPYGRAERWLP